MTEFEKLIQEDVYLILNASLQRDVEENLRMKNAFEDDKEIMNKIVQAGVGVYVTINGNGPLLLKRQGSHGAGKWSFPGGKIDFGETVLECAARELLEETGLILENAYVISTFTEDMFPDDGKQFITLYVYGEAIGEPYIMEPEKVSEIMLLSRGADLPTPLFCGVEKIREICG